MCVIFLLYSTENCFAECFLFSIRQEGGCNRRGTRRGMRRGFRRGTRKGKKRT
jgi:hypothetical protein